MEDIFEFIEYVKKEFNNRFTIHAHPISKLGNEDRECICDYAFSEIAEEIIGEYFATSDIRNDFSLLRCQTFGEFVMQVCYSYAIDAKGAIRKCTVCLTDEKNKVGEIIDRENFHMNFYALSQWTECKLSLDECTTASFIRYASVAFALTLSLREARNADLISRLYTGILNLLQICYIAK